MILFAALVVISILVFIPIFVKVLGPNQKEYAGVVLTFRTNIKDAEDVRVIPNEQTLKDLFLRVPPNRIDLVWIDNETENPYYAVDGFEIAAKLSVIYQYNFGINVDIVPANVSSVDEVRNLLEQDNIVILMLGPSHANKTAVTVENNLVILEGQSLETNKEYTDIDLSTTKVLLTLME